MSSSEQKHITTHILMINALMSCLTLNIMQSLMVGRETSSQTSKTFGRFSQLWKIRRNLILFNSDSVK